MERALETQRAIRVTRCGYRAPGHHRVFPSHGRPLQPALRDAASDHSLSRQVVLRYMVVRGKGVSTAVDVVKSMDRSNVAHSADTKNLPRECASADIVADDAHHVREGSYPFCEGDIESVAFHAALISQGQLCPPYGRQGCKRRDQHERPYFDLFRVAIGCGEAVAR
jgi:hypothetical protein